MQDGWCYLAYILDLHSQKIISYEFSRRLDESIVLNALDKATLKQGKPKNVIIHTNRGNQYLSRNYIKSIENYGVKRSYTTKGNPYGNAVIESFHAILRKEEIYRNIYQTYKKANLAIFEFIES
ncbi:DDE-type integrase/transposase/recombinase [Geosporobacter ferrireducens]|uniref:DDE-type integrase/transposase/recombinase n=1 Tax=Geosporobacter ferrireducens TaxID=1424294 RepID=UPI0009F68A0C|nr:DDE-type integrase/transposase/recombinase [Geosporobacter ferrireducens]